MQTVLSRSPMAANQLQQFVRTGLLAREGRNEVGDFYGRLLSLRALARDLADLLHSGPIEVVIQRGGADQRSPFKTTMSLVECAGGLAFRFSFLLVVGGKRPPHRRPVPARWPAIN